MKFLLVIFFVDDFSEIALHCRMSSRLVSGDRLVNREIEDDNLGLMHQAPYSKRPVSSRKSGVIDTKGG